MTSFYAVSALSIGCLIELLRKSETSEFKDLYVNVALSFLIRFLIFGQPRFCISWAAGTSYGLFVSILAALFWIFCYRSLLPFETSSQKNGCMTAVLDNNLRDYFSVEIVFPKQLS